MMFFNVNFWRRSRSPPKSKEYHRLATSAGTKLGKNKYFAGLRNRIIFDMKQAGHSYREIQEVFNKGGVSLSFSTIHKLVNGLHTRSRRLGRGMMRNKAKFQTRVSLSIRWFRYYRHTKQTPIDSLQAMIDQGLEPP